MRNPLEVIHDTIVFDSKDYGQSKKDITLYAIAVGWDDASYQEFMDRGKLTQDAVDYLKTLHKQYKELL